MMLGWAIIGIFLALCLLSKGARKELGEVIGEIWEHAEHTRSTEFNKRGAKRNEPT